MSAPSTGTTTSTTTSTTTDEASARALPRGARALGVDGPHVPVGTVIAFAGRKPEDPRPQGWLVCDGRDFPTTGEYAELFSVIGYAFGQPASDRFCLPSLGGWFVRGTCPDPAARDEREPDWQGRRSATSIHPRSLSDTPHAVGSRQAYATAAPHTSFTASHDHLNISKAHDDAGCATRPGRYTDATQTFTATGGDLESRPVNKNVTYLIKVRPVTDPAETLPVGALVPFAGQLDRGPAAPAWRVCHGDALATLDVPDLWDALGYVHGGTDGTLVLPDYRGWFHRGHDTTRTVDPEALNRGWAHPKGAPGAQGNHGNEVGSSQAAATGAPTSTPFTTTLSHLPTDDADKRVAGDLWDLLQASGGSSPMISLSSSGGDHETRPVNVSVDWYVRSQGGADPGDPYPVGAVALMAGTLEDNEWWKPCDGSTVPADGHAALQQALGTTYGGDASNVALPDYRSRFLRGASYDSGVDPDAASRTANPGVPTGGVGTLQDWATGQPVNPFQGSIPHYSESDLGAHGATNDGNAEDDGVLTFATCTGGGDSETRPCNVYLNHYIRVR